jgi:predicted glutamine amidotransferase
MGGPILLSDVISKPVNSIIKQAHHQVVYCPFLETSPLYNPEEAKERNHTINPDGFGVAFYISGISEPCLFRDVTPAWSNQNLIEIGKIVKCSVMLVHVRAARCALLYC